MSFRVIFRLEKCITQRNRLNTFHADITRKLRVDVEEYRHVYRLSRIQPLLLEAEALDLREIRRHLARCHAVRSHPNDILLRRVGRRIESERGLAGQNTNFALLGDELPREDVRCGAVEGYANARVVFDGTEALGGVASIVAVSGGLDGLATPASGLAYLTFVRVVLLPFQKGNVPFCKREQSHKKAQRCRE